MKFQPGNQLGKLGKNVTKNRLARTVLEDLLAIWNEPMMAGNKPMTDANGEVVKRGVAALRVMSKERPADFCKLFGALMPKELHIETAAAEMDDAELDKVIDAMREHVRALRDERMVDITPAKKELAYVGE